ncbi:MAG: type II toxin-antitoxin system VapC family toxin [Nocardioidaceae bacterium]
MSHWYIDASAAMKLLVTDAESDVLGEAITRAAPDLVACYLLETEVRRSAHTHALAQTEATELLESVSLHEMPASLFREAGLLAGDRLRSLDALHVVAAVSIGVDQILTYDDRQSEAARAAGLTVYAPGKRQAPTGSIR